MSAANRTLQITTPSDREIAMTRAFDAPRELVFEAWTNPEHVRQWWGPRSGAIVTCEADVRPGGSWRYVTRSESGDVIPLTGVYQEVMPPERLVHTEIYDVEPFNQGEPPITTVTFTDEEGGTLVTSVTLYPSREIRDAVLSGMESGADEIYDRFDDYLRTIA
jgi:uncharacterized protein YndB with AHSA1/START domain